MTWITVASISGTFMLIWELFQTTRVMRCQSLLLKDRQRTIKALQEQMDGQDDDMSCLSQKLFAANNKIAMLTLQNEDLRKTITSLTDAAEEE